MKYFVWFIRLIVFVIVLLFALNNTAPVRVSFFGGTYVDLPLIIVFLIVFAVGALFAYLFTIPSFFRQRRKISHLRSETNQLQDRVNTLLRENEANFSNATNLPKHDFLGGLPAKGSTHQISK